jgi:hypothetical protein
MKCNEIKYEIESLIFILGTIRGQNVYMNGDIKSSELEPCLSSSKILILAV